MTKRGFKQGVIPKGNYNESAGCHDRTTLKQQIGAIVETIEQAGGRIDYVGSPLGLEEKGRGAYPDANPLSRFVFRKMFSRTMVMGAAIHEAGGARMGDDAKTSVLNGWNQSWDLPNLLVTDASAFASSGVSGTTLTIMAMTARKGWWAHQDSNLEPDRYERSALTIEL